MTHNWQDLANGALELSGGLFILNHCRAVMRDRRVAGVSKLSIALFTLWGVWNIYYYPSLGQWASMTGGLMVVAANALYLGLLWRFRNA